jgi:2Fe-2S ferredoxin
MTLLTIMPSGKTVEVGEGTTLLSAILGSDMGPSHKCSSACHVFVHEGRKGLSKIAREENEQLDAIVGVGSKSRLACQAKVLGTEDIKIELLDFASGI